MKKRTCTCIKECAQFFKNKEKFTLEDIEKLHNDKPEFFKPNMKHKRNEGSKNNKGQKLYKKARQIIPGGTSLLSKNPDLFFLKSGQFISPRQRKCSLGFRRK